MYGYVDVYADVYVDAITNAIIVVMAATTITTTPTPTTTPGSTVFLWKVCSGRVFVRASMEATYLPKISLSLT